MAIKSKVGGAGARAAGASTSSAPKKQANAKGKGKMTMTLPVSSSKGASQATGSNMTQPKPARERGEDDEDEEDDGFGDSEDDEDEYGSMDTDEEIQLAQAGTSKSKKTLKRKRRATSPTSFGATMQSLLGPTSSAARTSTRTDEAQADASQDEEQDEDGSRLADTDKRSKKSTANPILALAPHLRRSAQSTKLSAKAHRLLLSQRKRRLELTRVRDVIGSWGAPGQLLDPETGDIVPTIGGARLSAAEVAEWHTAGGTQGYEKKLRKVAQRGVVKLFNAIKVAQDTSLDDVDDVRQSALVRSVMPKEAPAKAQKPTIPGVANKVTKHDPKASLATAGNLKNVLGGKQAALKDLSKSNFLDAIRSGAKA